MKTLEYKGYLGSADVDIEDNILHGKLLHIRDLVTYQADTPEELLIEFRAAVDFYLDDCLERGVEPDRPFKGVFNVRVKPDLHRFLAQSAKESSVSLNEMISIVIEAYRAEKSSSRMEAVCISDPWCTPFFDREIESQESFFKTWFLYATESASGVSRGSIVESCRVNDKDNNASSFMEVKVLGGMQ
ncbi:type II toxin-antitoxin system HicB family antitoxin [Limimaricola litoreus]|uniref:Type II toxin-antitoxin system HicB family antitoxin n=1 Tax=Limimaricola litoreus TaxID=2955316 RepID=A0A9X2JP77_9RHOB|nr:type II toxin-antitoxin system HicB family antitoxin [Limimaricola litoreus]MCP1168494.1 type II toxin-antitoxin system HicB family antitoxin [Limimaricola litoreus]